MVISASWLVGFLRDYVFFGFTISGLVESDFRCFCSVLVRAGQDIFQVIFER